MKQYQVYTRPNTWELEKIVNEQLEKGGELVGGVVVLIYPYTPYDFKNVRDYNPKTQYSQAMLIVKEEEK